MTSPSVFMQTAVRGVNDRLVDSGLVFWPSEKVGHLVSDQIAEKLAASYNGDELLPEKGLDLQRVAGIAQLLKAASDTLTQKGVQADVNLKTASILEPIEKRAERVAAAVMRKVADNASLTNVGTNTPESAAAVDQHARLDQQNRPSQEYNNGVGKTDLPDGRPVGREMPHPKAPSNTAPVSNSLTDHSQKAAGIEELIHKLQAAGSRGLDSARNTVGLGRPMHEQLLDRAKETGIGGMDALKGLAGRAGEMGSEGLDALKGLAGRAGEMGSEGLGALRGYGQQAGLLAADPTLLDKIRALGAKGVDLAQAHPGMALGGAGLAGLGLGAGLHHMLSDSDKEAALADLALGKVAEDPASNAPQIPPTEAPPGGGMGGGDDAHDAQMMEKLKAYIDALMGQYQGQGPSSPESAAALTGLAGHPQGMETVAHIIQTAKTAEEADGYLKYVYANNPGLCKTASYELVAQVHGILNQNAKTAANTEDQYWNILKQAAKGSLTNVAPNTPEDAAKHDEHAALDLKNRPAKKHNLGVGKTELPNTGQQFDVKPVEGGPDKKHPDTVPAREAKGASLTDDEALYINYFKKTAEEVGPYLPISMSQEEKIATVRQLMALSPAERDNVMAQLRA